MDKWLKKTIHSIQTRHIHSRIRTSQTEVFSLSRIIGRLFLGGIKAIFNANFSVYLLSTYPCDFHRYFFTYQHYTVLHFSRAHTRTHTRIVSRSLGISCECMYLHIPICLLESHLAVFNEDLLLTSTVTDTVTDFYTRAAF